MAEQLSVLSAGLYGIVIGIQSCPFVRCYYVHRGHNIFIIRGKYTV